jgi:hypothetical protein
MLENLLLKFEKFLHSNHFVMISIKNALVDSYGHLKGFLLSELTDALLRRKIELCEELLGVLDVFESGKSRARGLMMYELHAPMVLYAESQHQWGNLTLSQYLKRLEKARLLLNDSLEILSWEDENVCKIVKVGKVQLENLDKCIESVKEI